MKKRLIRTLAVMCVASVLLVGMAATAFAADEDYSERIEEISRWLDGQTVTRSGGYTVPANPTPPSNTAVPTVTVLSADELQAYADKAFELTNAQREQAGFSPLERDSLLDEAAMLRASEVKIVDDAGGKPHTRPDGTSYKDLLDTLGVTGRRCGENIARAEPSPDEAIEAWMASDGHRANILRDNYGSIGIGVYQREDGQLNWIQIFMLQ